MQAFDHYQGRSFGLLKNLNVQEVVVAATEIAESLLVHLILSVSQRVHWTRRFLEK